MNTSTDRDRHGRDVDNKVADLTEEVVLVGIPLCTATSWNIWIGVKHGKALKVGGSLDDREIVRIANKLCVVVLNDRPANKVGTRREVDNGWFDGRGIAALATSRARGDGGVDCSSVVS